MLLRTRTTLSALLAVGALTACMSSRPALQVVPHVDLPRYMGDWFVIANIPYAAEKDCLDSIESYALRSDGRIDNWFQCRKKSFSAPMERKATAVAAVEDDSSNAVWTVHFWKIIPIKYLILELDPDYQWVAVGHPSRRVGWIMARKRSLPDATYEAILARLSAQGYDPAKFIKVPQEPEKTQTDRAQADQARPSPN
jgi:apolipoprotein D and lipocalin family protein